MEQLKNNKFKLLCLLQVWVVIALVRYCIVLGDQSVLFQEVKEFLPTNATCIESDRRSYGTGRRRRVSYTNKYQYTVNEETYTVTYYGQRRRGRDKILYYNPTDPNIVSNYSSYGDAAARNAIWIIFVVLGQSVVIFFAVKAIRENKGYNSEPATTGVVIEDDFSFDMSDRDYSFSSRTPSTQQEESQEVETIAFPGWNAGETVESIPFSRRNEKQEENEIETIAFARKEHKPAEDFVLYTEDEYKQMQKEK